MRNIMHGSDIAEGLEYWRKKLFAGIMLYLPPLGLLLVLPSLIVVLNTGNPGLAISYVLTLLIVTFIALYPDFALSVRKNIFLLVLYFIASVLLYYLNIMGAALTYFYSITIFALLIASTRTGIATIFINALIFIIYGILIYTGSVEYILRDSYQVASWLTIASSSLILSIVSVILLPILFEGLEDTISKYRSSQKDLNRSLSDLKDKNREVLLAQTRYNTVCKITNEVIWEWDFENDVHLWMGEHDKLLRTSADSSDVSLESWFEKIHPDDLERVKSTFLNAAGSDDIRDWREEYRFKREDGTYAWVLDRGFIIRDPDDKPVRFVGGMLDISDMKNNEILIRESLEEKETLLAEIHHRVKNNLAAVTGMLQLQLFQEENEELSEKLIDSMMRIKSIANIHEQLYNSNSFSRIDLGRSLEQLISTVIETMGTGTDIELQVETDDVTISVNEAIPCSLVVNEVVTNIIKHAFTGMEKGIIQLRVKSRGNASASCSIEIIDNGIGLPEGFPEKADKKLGMELISTLTRQLEADYGYRTADGEGTTAFYMAFRSGIQDPEHEEV
ncbi:MAG: histidine kinase dimerization/phosphoacceptor domain -containing protein [Balneolaceae bacterium]|nr:histidine kinase dimerization/phosphoacceptor domain -containing protein [Balneolaceae bacterium]